MELSGVAWCERYPGSRSTADLVEPFQTSVEQFITALESAGARVSISATLRPPHRAWLMRQAWDIDHGLVAPSAVVAREGVPIQWVHPSAAESLAAARAMVQAYRLAVRPSPTSRHIEGRAIDMTIAWSGVIRPRDANRCVVELDAARGLQQQRLYDLGAAYGVVKLVSDPPHWSTDGR